MHALRWWCSALGSTLLCVCEQVVPRLGLRFLKVVLPIVCVAVWGLARVALEGGYIPHGLYEKKDARLSCGVRALGVGLKH